MCIYVFTLFVYKSIHMYLTVYIHILLYAGYLTCINYSYWYNVLRATYMYICKYMYKYHVSHYSTILKKYDDA